MAWKCGSWRPRRRRKREKDTQSAVTSFSKVSRRHHARLSTSVTENSEREPLLDTREEDYQREYVNRERDLIQAVQDESYDRVQQHLRQGLLASTICESTGRSLLWMATRLGRVDLVKLLLQYGADVHVITTDHSQVALHAACWRGDIEVAHVLLAHGAYINAVNDFGNTPLHWACKYGHVEIVQLLLRKGANSQIRNSQHETPLDVAHARVLPLLREATFWGLCLPKRVFSVLEWHGRLVRAISTLSEAQVYALVLKLSVAQGQVATTQADEWIQRALDKVGHQPHTACWDALVHDCRQAGILATPQLPGCRRHRATTVHQVNLGIDFLEHLQVALQENPVHGLVLDGSPASTHKQLLLFCRALLQAQRLDESPMYDDLAAMQITVRAVALVLQLAQMGRSVDWWFAICGQLHLLDSVALIRRSVPSNELQAFHRGETLAMELLDNIQDDHAYAPLRDICGNLAIVLGLVTTLLERGVLKRHLPSVGLWERRNGSLVLVKSLLSGNF